MDSSEFKKLRNIRDFGGMKTESGKTVKPGVMIRSSYLYKITRKDADILSRKYRVKKIIDLRSPHEKAKKPDVPVDGAEYIENPYFDLDTLEMTSGMGSDVRSAIKNAENRQELIDNVPDLVNVYPIMASSDYAVSQMSKCIKMIFSNRDGAVLFHCTAGKDRTGTTSAVILRLLGISDEDIMKDYLETNRFYKKTSESYSRLIRIFMRDKILADKVRRVFLADKSYLEAFYSEVNNRFGSFDSFVYDGLKLTSDEIDSFREYILE